MYDADPTITAPLTPPPPPPPPSSTARAISATRLIALGLLAFALVALTVRLDVADLVSDARNAIDRAPEARTTTSADVATIAAIKDVVERANLAQAEAFRSGDTTVMLATSTDSYYRELVQTNRALASGGIRTIELSDIEWGDITVNGSTAIATTHETWRSSFNDGGTLERTNRNDYTLVQQAGQWKISAVVQPDARVIVPDTAPNTTQPGTPAAATSRSSNWSGYAASGGVFTSVTGSWIVPTVSGTSPGSDATWVGIGGLTTRDLIQAGTMATATGAGDVSYQSWIEMLPAAARTVPLAVTAGDSVTVTITEKGGGDWLIAMKNSTTGGTYSITVQYDSSNSSAEWVQEAPSVGRGLVPLSQFGTLQFTGGGAVRDGKTMSIEALGAKAITMINGAGEALAQPSTLASDGSSFTVTRTDASPTTGGRRRRP